MILARGDEDEDLDLDLTVFVELLLGFLDALDFLEDEIKVGTAT